MCHVPQVRRLRCKRLELPGRVLNSCPSVAQAQRQPRIRDLAKHLADQGALPPEPLIPDPREPFRYLRRSRRGLKACEAPRIVSKHVTPGPTGTRSKARRDETCSKQAETTYFLGLLDMSENLGSTRDSRLEAKLESPVDFEVGPETYKKDMPALQI